MFEGFEQVRVETEGASINAVRGGEGPPVLLLHGYPQTLAMWHLVAPRIADSFTVVAADLRGYGDSSRPEGGEDHAGYSKRAMALDQVEVMRELGFDTFAVAGHDRGARVAHRMALDHPEIVTKLAVLDIVPTRHVYATVGKDLATAYYHWFFLIQPYDLPERLLGAEPDYFLGKTLGGYGTGTQVFAPEAYAEYQRYFRDPKTIHAMCEDYRAAATIDLDHDEADRGRKVGCPLLALWGGRVQWKGSTTCWKFGANTLPMCGAGRCRLDTFCARRALKRWRRSWSLSSKIKVVRVPLASRGRALVSCLGVASG